MKVTKRTNKNNCAKEEASRCQYFRRLTLWVLPIFWLLPIGCGGGPSYGEVEGIVMRNGKPLPGVEVVFMPDPGQGTKGPDASALTDDEGRYHLRTGRTERNGAIVGKHRVCIIQPQFTLLQRAREEDKNSSGASSKRGEAEDKARKLLSSKGRVPPEYQSPSDTPFQSVEVKPGKQTLNFDLK